MENLMMGRATRRRFLWSAAGTGALAGLFATSQVSLPQWNWYGFPIAFAFSQGLELVIGWGLAGAVMGWYVKR